jgi:hypothetical protein
MGVVCSDAPVIYYWLETGNGKTGAAASKTQNRSNLLPH